MSCGCDSAEQDMMHLDEAAVGTRRVTKRPRKARGPRKAASKSRKSAKLKAALPKTVAEATQLGRKVYKGKRGGAYILRKGRKVSLKK